MTFDEITTRVSLSDTLTIVKILFILIDFFQKIETFEFYHLMFVSFTF